MLKKEFKEKDVNRIRNLVLGKAHEKTVSQAGYLKSNTERQEGEVWEEKGKLWTIKDGIKENVTKLDDLKKLFLMPLSCPNCGKPMNSSEYNKKMYSIHRKCGECVVEMETQLKAVGKYEEYLKNIVSSNRNSIISELEKFLNEYDSFKSTFLGGNGEVEEWTDTNNNNEKKELIEFIEKLKESKV